MIKKFILNYIKKKMHDESFRMGVQRAYFEGLEEAFTEDNHPTLISFQMLEVMRYHIKVKPVLRKRGFYYKDHERLAALGRSAADDFLVDNGVKRDDLKETCPTCRVLTKDW